MLVENNKMGNSYPGTQPHQNIQHATRTVLHGSKPPLRCPQDINMITSRDSYFLLYALHLPFFSNPSSLRTHKNFPILHACILYVYVCVSVSKYVHFLGLLERRFPTT
jgi:hypothetical protein